MNCWLRIWLTFARCLLVVEILGLLELASRNGLFKVGKASLFNRIRNASLHSMRSIVRVFAEMLRADSTVRWRIELFTFAEFNSYLSSAFPLRNEKKLIPLGFFWLSLLQPYTGHYMLQLWLAYKWNPAKLHSHLYSMYSKQTSLYYVTCWPQNFPSLSHAKVCRVFFPVFVFALYRVYALYANISYFVAAHPRLPNFKSSSVQIKRHWFSW